MGLIDCYANFGVHFNIIRKERESRLYRVSMKSVKARKGEKIEKINVENKT